MASCRGFGEKRVSSPSVRELVVPGQAGGVAQPQGLAGPLCSQNSGRPTLPHTGESWKAWEQRHHSRGACLEPQGAQRAPETLCLWFPAPGELQWGLRPGPAQGAAGGRSAGWGAQGLPALEARHFPKRRQRERGPGSHSCKCSQAVQSCGGLPPWGALTLVPSLPHSACANVPAGGRPLPCHRRESLRPESTRAQNRVGVCVRQGAQPRGWLWFEGLCGLNPFIWLRSSPHPNVLASFIDKWCPPATPPRRLSLGTTWMLCHQACRRLPGLCAGCKRGSAAIWGRS